MTTYEIERRLRLPAPDEPAFLPELILPSLTAGLGGVRIRARGIGQRGGVLSPRLVLAVLALLAAMISAIATGALRLDRLPNPFDASADFGGDGISIVYPDGWARLTPSDPFNGSGASTVLLVSSAGVEACADGANLESPAPEPVASGGEIDGSSQQGTIYALEDRILACVIEQPIEAGEIRIVVTQGMPQRIGVGPFGDFDPEAFFEGVNPEFGFYLPTEDDGWTEEIDGMPAKLVVATSSVTPGADEVRTWIVLAPGGNPGPWYVQVTLRGPDLEELRVRADEIARSLRFDQHPPALDVATRDAGLARILDKLDRESRRWQGSDLFSCFPRSPGAVEATIDDILYEGRPGGRLAEPLPVTCTTTVEATPFGIWYATFVLSWEAGDGWPAGEWAWYAGFDGVGNEAGSSGQLSSPVGFVSPGNAGELPPPLEEPLDIPIGAIVEVVPPGLLQTIPDGPIQAYYQDPNPEIGDRLAVDAQPGTRYGVVAGPISHAGYDWYQVESQHGTSYPSEFVWIPSTDGLRPLVRIVEPDCRDDPSVLDLVHLQPLERVRCYGDRDLTLAGAIAVLEEDEGNLGAVDGDPAWLAKFSLWRLYGPDGPEGLDGALPFAIDPSLGESLPTRTPITVTGHFDDAAAAACRRTVPEGWPNQESPELQRLRCRELFVITSVE